MIHPEHSAGVEMFTYGLLNGLVASGSGPLHVKILAGTIDHWKARVPADDIAWIESPLPFRTDNRYGDLLRRWTPGGVKDSRWVRKTVNTVRQRSIDRHPEADVALVPSSSLPVPRIPSVLVMHDFRSFQPAFARAGAVALQRSNIARAGAVVVTWPHPFHEAVTRFPEANDRTTLIPTPAFQSAPQGCLARAREPGLLVYPSSTANHKNHVTLLEAMALLPDCTLICPGPLAEPEASRLLARAAQPDLAGRVSFPGFVARADLESIYARADAVVVPSLWEAASGAMLEAFTWGLPIACADSAPLLSQLDFAGAEAAVFEALDPVALAAAVRRLMSRRDTFAASSLLAGRRLAGRTWAATGRDYLDVLRWVAEERPGPIPRSAFGNDLARASLESPTSREGRPHDHAQ